MVIIIVIIVIIFSFFACLFVPSIRICTVTVFVTGKKAKKNNVDELLREKDTNEDMQLWEQRIRIRERNTCSNYFPLSLACVFHLHFEVALDNKHVVVLFFQGSFSRERERERGRERETYRWLRRNTNTPPKRANTQIVLHTFHR